MGSITYETLSNWTHDYFFGGSNTDDIKQKVLHIMPYLLFITILTITLPSFIVCAILMTYPFVSTPPVYEMYFWAALFLSISGSPSGFVETLLYHGSIMILFATHAVYSNIPSQVQNVMHIVAKHVFTSGVDMIRVGLDYSIPKLQAALNQNRAT